MSWVMRSPSCSQRLEVLGERGVLGEARQQLAQQQRRALHVAPAFSTSVTSVRVGRRGGEQAHPQGYATSPAPASSASRVLHDSITTSQPVRGGPSESMCRWRALVTTRAPCMRASSRSGSARVSCSPRGRALTLSVREFELLVAMARRAGAIVTREELYAAVWGGELRAGDRSVDVYVSKLRNKLEQAMPDRRFIHTHPGFGYRFQPQPRVRPGSRRARWMPSTSPTPPRSPPKDFHEMFTSGRSSIHETGPQPLPAGRGLRVRADARTPVTSTYSTYITQSEGETLVIHQKIGALAGVAALALGLAACGSSPPQAPARRRAPRAAPRGTISGAGSTFAAPVYQQWGSSLSRLTVNYQAVGSGAGITALESQDRRLRRQRPAAEAGRLRDP